MRIGRFASVLAIVCFLLPGIRMSSVKGNTGEDDVEVLKDVEYGKGGGRPLRMHLLRPKTRSERPLPVVVWVHGGAWMEGNRDEGLRRLPRLVRRGYLCASIEYRLSPESTFPAQIEDCKCAIRFLRANARQYGLDPNRIGVWGASAGGHLVALLGTTGGVKALEGKGGWEKQSSRVQAVVDFFGPTDFLKMDAAGSRFRHDAPGSPESRLIGGPIQENKEKVARANPISYITKNTPPFLILHGEKDDIVPLNQSELLSAALTKTGVEVTFRVVKGAGHGFGGEPIDAMVDAFLDKHLKSK
jgi:acetyl esterase/lipase